MKRRKSKARQVRTLVVLIVVGVALNLGLWLASTPEDWKGLGLSMATELLGAVVTYVLLELIVERTESEETEKQRLILELGSKVQDVALAAAEKLRAEGWLFDGSCTGADLSGALLFGAILRGANLREAILRWANLSEAKLSRADLCWAFLIGAKLRGADLHGADLHEAILSGADLVGADLSEADLSGADLVGAILRGANLSEAKLEGANLNAAKLEGANLNAANLDTSTILPNGTKWTPETDMTRFTEKKQDEA